jgi:hypothetical protein
MKFDCASVGELFDANSGEAMAALSINVDFSGWDGRRLANFNRKVFALAGRVTRRQVGDQAWRRFQQQRNGHDKAGREASRAAKRVVRGDPLKEPTPTGRPAQGAVLWIDLAGCDGEAVESDR